MGLFTKTYDKARAGTDIGPRESNPFKRLGGSANKMVHDPKFWTWAGLMSGGLAAGGAAASTLGGSLNDIADASKSMDGGRYRSLGKFFGGADGFGMDDVLKYGSAIGEGYGAYHRSNAQDKLTRMSEDEWRRRQPLRDAGMKALLDDSKPDTSATFADPYAPTGRYRRINVGSGGY